MLLWETMTIFLYLLYIFSSTNAETFVRSVKQYLQENNSIYNHIVLGDIKLDLYDDTKHFTVISITTVLTVLLRQ